ncbi:MAG: hypothetical protein AAGF12_04295, partial [Myxococcota bacterium]
MLLLAGGCDFSTKPSVAPRASLSGTIAYQGPRPRCRDTEIDGDIILQLYRGRTTSPFEVETPVDTVRIEVEQLFNIPGDCGTAGPPVMRELPFEMRNVGPRPSATEAEVFRLVAFWDRDANHDEDDPLREQPTFGDIYGAAYENAAMIPRRFRELVLEPPSQNPDGQQVDDVLVTMDGEVRTERPLFRMATMAALSRRVSSRLWVSSPAKATDARSPPPAAPPLAELEECGGGGRACSQSRESQAFWR